MPSMSVTRAIPVVMVQDEPFLPFRLGCLTADPSGSATSFATAGTLLCRACRFCTCQHALANLGR